MYLIQIHVKVSDPSVRPQILGQELRREKIDYKAELSAHMETKRTATVFIGSDPYPVTIAGIEGLAYPVYEDGSYKLPPKLFWWDNGIEYYMSAWKLGFTDKQLIKAAESMYK